jgi:Ca2+-binding RTX toxin-like protein
MSTPSPTIVLDNAIFTKLKTDGTLKGNAFFEGRKAHDGNDRIIYNDQSGALTYDRNGDDKGKAVKFAILSDDLNLSKGDFFVI